MKKIDNFLLNIDYLTTEKYNPNLQLGMILGFPTEYTYYYPYMAPVVLYIIFMTTNALLLLPPRYCSLVLECKMTELEISLNVCWHDQYHGFFLVFVTSKTLFLYFITFFGEIVVISWSFKVVYFVKFVIHDNSLFEKKTITIFVFANT